MTQKPAQTRQPQDKYLIRTVTFRYLLDPKKPESYATAYEALSDLPDMTTLPTGVTAETGECRFWNKPKAE